MAEKTSQSPVISVKNVDKIFRLPHERTTTVKSLFTNFARGSGSKYYEEQQALENISFDIKKGEFFGIVGRNGSGKSTLLKILAGIYQPTEGTVEVNGRLVPFIELGVGFNPELTGRENVYLNGAMLGFSEAEVTERYQEIVGFAELEEFMDQKLKNYSSGMQVRLAFSMAIRAKADILLIDEILAVGDADFQRKCFEYFRNVKKMEKTVVFVGHDMSAIREYCDRGVLIEDGEVAVRGSSDKIANAYTRMFIEQQDDQEGSSSSDTGSRRGDRDVEFTSLSVSPGGVITNKNDTINLNMELTSHVKIEGLVAGFKIKNSAGALLVGANNKLLKHHINKLNKGDRIKLTWEIPNIFNDGTYNIDAATESNAGRVLDWWEEAATFTVAREEKTGFTVSPNIRLSIKELKND